MSDVTEAWHAFCERIQVFPSAKNALNGPCAPETIQHVETALGFGMPDPLKQVLALNNGQRLDSIGIFKSVSGWDLYRRHVILDALSIGQAYQNFVGDEILAQEYGHAEIPFAVSGTPERYSEAFTIHRQSGAISLIWTEYPDPFNPPKWQVWKFPRAENLAEFLWMQTRFY
jgi:hypothetical protein